MAKFFITRFHDFSCAHRAWQDKGKCGRWHGHNYRIHVTVCSESSPELDEQGRVIDFDVLKNGFFQWIEETVDHRMIIEYDDPLLDELSKLTTTEFMELRKSLWRITGYSTSTESLAAMFADIAQSSLPKGYKVAEIKLEETAKCSVIYQPE